MKTMNFDRRLNEFFVEFNKKEIHKLEKLDWLEVINKAKKLSEKLNNCMYCNQEKPKYFCEIKKDWDKKAIQNEFLGFFCSPDCIKKYLNKHIQNNKIEDISSPAKRLKNKAVNKLAFWLEPIHFKRLEKLDMNALIKKRYKDE